jgi:hypothetical protein
MGQSLAVALLMEYEQQNQENSWSNGGGGEGGVFWGSWERGQPQGIARAMPFKALT